MSPGQHLKEGGGGAHLRITPDDRDLNARDDRDLDSRALPEALMWFPFCYP